jgi:VanZ family protein
VLCSPWHSSRQLQPCQSWQTLTNQISGCPELMHGVISPAPRIARACRHGQTFFIACCEIYFYFSAEICCLACCFFLLCLLVGYLALAPRPPAKADLFSWDKLNHAAAFAALAWAAMLGFRERLVYRRYVALGLVAYGAAIEIAQWFTTGRSCEWRDLLTAALMQSPLNARQ